jgi:phosphodiesterase/alkaline phosphatase D-like protein
MKEIILVALLHLGATRDPQIIKIHSPHDYLSIAFGSCYGMDNHTSQIFQTISEQSPDLFIWTGDAYYVDHSPRIEKG